MQREMAQMCESLCGDCAAARKSEMSDGAIGLGTRGRMEYKLKAIYLRKIPNFVEWPELVGAKVMSTNDPIHLCVIGNYAFGSVLAQEAGRAGTNGKKMDVRWVQKETQFKGCQVIFVSRSEEKRYRKIVEISKGFHALTVGETEGFLEVGGIISLNFKDGTLQFEANLEAARAAQLKLDARWLAMAKRVVREKEQAGI